MSKMFQACEEDFVTPIKIEFRQPLTLLDPDAKILAAWEKKMQADDIVDAVLTYLSDIKGVGDELESLSNADYDRLEDDLCKIVEKVLNKGS